MAASGIVAPAGSTYPRGIAFALDLINLALLLGGIAAAVALWVLGCFALTEVLRWRRKPKALERAAKAAAECDSGIRYSYWIREPEEVLSSIRIPPRRLQDVRFTIYHPKEIVPRVWETLLVYTHIAEMEDWVQTDATSRLERPESHGPRTGQATRGIARGTEIVIVPELPGCRFNPPTDRFLWLEPAHRREFRLQVNPEVPGFEPGTAVNGRVAFYVTSILVAEVTIWTFIADQVTPVGLMGGTDVQAMPSGGQGQPVTAMAAPYSAIFVSYAHDDGTVVARIGAAYKALGMSFLRDQEVLRSGEKWNARLLDLIERADIFQLYWSSKARRSRYVRQEWSHALQQKRDNFIRPVYWQKPLPKPPRELEDLHFAHLPLDD